MKVLQVVSMGYVCGGAEKSVALLRDELRARGHDIKIMSSDRDPSVPHFSDYECRHIQGKTPLGIVRHLWSRSAYKELKRALAEFQPDVIHFHTMGELSPSVLFAAANRPSVLTVHGPEEYTTTMLEWYLPPTLFKWGKVDRRELTVQGQLYYLFFRYVQRPLYARGFRRLKRMLAPSKFLAARLAEEGFKPAVTQVYNGISLPAQQPFTNTKQLLYVGRLDAVKGVDVLLRAMPDIRKQYPDCRLRIVGDGPDRAHLENIRDEYKLTDYADFCGWLQGDDLMAEYTEAALVVIPSIWPENLPTVALEALAVGRPVVGSRVGGIPELIEHGQTGAIVTPGDSLALANAIVRLLGDANLAAKAQAARDSATRFELSVFAANLEALYTEIIG